VFELVNNGGGSYTLTTLVSFNGTNGSIPVAGLIADAAGNLFGTTNAGGANNEGTVFEITGSGFVTPGNAYITNSGSNNVSVIDTATNTVTATIPVGVGTNPAGVAVSPDGSKVYVANTHSNNVSVIATATNTVTATIVVGADPLGVAGTPDGSKVYVANTNSGGNSVSVLATATNTVTAIPIGNGSVGVAVTPDGSRVYVTNGAVRTVSVIATATNTVTATIPVGTEPYGVAVTPDGSRVYVANVQSNTVSVIATATNTVTATIPVGTNPRAFGIFIHRPPLFILPPSEVATTASGLSYSRVTRTFNGTVTITNISSVAISGPFSILFTALTSGVTLVKATGDFSGSPFLTIPAVASLASGQSATVSVQFGDPSFGVINFTPVIYSGNI
jgi:YVTN family beta-propeller protein/uncharacterized repeat protein (TIGR03803 family)